MGQKYLIDTCAIIKYLNQVYPADALLFLDQVVDIQSNISFITKIELLVWNPQDPNDLLIFEAFVADSVMHLVNDAIINLAIIIRKNTGIKLPDAVIAATAIYNDFVLISDNEKDFNRAIPIGLKFINPINI